MTARELNFLLTREGLDSLLIPKGMLHLHIEKRDMDGVAWVQAIATALLRCWLGIDSSKDPLAKACLKHLPPANFNKLLNSLPPWPVRANRAMPAQEYGDTFLNSINAQLVKMASCFAGADGIILLVHGNSAVPIPFIVERSNGGVSVHDIYQREIVAWSKEIEPVSRHFQEGMVVKLPLNAFGFDGKPQSFSGGSLALPVAWAWERKRLNLDIAAFDVMLTGAFDGEGRLEKVCSIEGKGATAFKLCARLFVAPGYGQGVKDSAFFIAPGVCSIKGALESIRKAAEDFGLANLDWRRAVMRMNELESDMRNGIVPLTRHALPLLDKIIATLEKDGKRRIFEAVKAKRVKASALCHLGKPAEASKLLEAIMQEAKRESNWADYFKLAAQQIVNLTDVGDFKAAQEWHDRYAPALQDAPVSCAEKIAWEMELTGSMAQTWMYWALSCGDSGDSGKACSAINCLDKALELAREQCDQGEESRVLNYRHLWMSFFAPAGGKEHEAYECAIASHNSLGDPQSRQRNMDFLCMQRWKAAYRLLLAKGEAYPGWRDFELPSVRTCDGWPLAMSLKYRGALLAKFSCFEEARHDFERAASLVRRSVDDMDLLGILGATVCVEAWRSLGASPEFSAEAEKFRNEALARFSRAETLETYRFASVWREFIGSNGQTQDPRQRYQY